MKAAIKIQSQTGRSGIWGWLWLANRQLELSGAAPVINGLPCGQKQLTPIKFLNSPIPHACLLCVIWVVGLTNLLAADLGSGSPTPVWLGQHSFGKVEGNSALTCELRLTNANSTPLLVEKVSASCDCLSVVSYPNSIAPHGLGRVLVAVKAQDPGRHDWTVWVEMVQSTATRQGVFTVTATVEEVTRSENTVSCLLSAGDFLASYDQSQDAIIDVRSWDRFVSVHIPGSMNLALYAVKTKSILMGRRIVLLNEGHENETLLSEIGKLRQNGFQLAHVLDGGLRAWQRAGGEVEDTRDLEAEAQFYRLAYP